MKKPIQSLIFTFFAFAVFLPDAAAMNEGRQLLLAQADAVYDASGDSSYEEDDLYAEEEFMMDEFEENNPLIVVADPFEPVNRVFFTFNDKLYFYCLKPAAKGYSRIVPSPARRGVKNFFKNLSFPVRFVNCLFQGKFEGAGHELGRFLVNSTLGVGGFMDRASSEFNIPEFDEDFGQTLAVYGLGHGFFINWPFMGPSSALDTVGSAGDAFLEPLDYLDLKTKYDVAIKGVEIVNRTSLETGQYESLKDAALDHYIAVRDAYLQYRRSEAAK